MNTLTSQQAVTGFTNRYLRKDGSYRWIEWRSQPVGSVVYAAARDITERLDSEAERLELERRLQQSQKLESIGVLAGGIAHDFNNLLTVILGNLDIAAEALDPKASIRLVLDEATHAAQRAADLTRQMLAYAGMGRFVIQSVDLNGLIMGLGQSFSNSVPETATFRLELESRLPSLQADPAQMRQVALSLFVNAAEALGGKTGVITLRTGVFEAGMEYLAMNGLSDSIPKGRYVFLEVSDTGCGMSPETQQRIFEPFFSTKFAGRGLGMAAVQGIVRAHKGAVLIESQQSVGSTIRVLLPAE
jgi:signal transduction histidine kinase